MSIEPNSVFECLQTERLLLRAPRREDVSTVLKIHGDPETNRYNPHGPMKSMEEALERMDTWIQSWANDGFGYWSVCSSNGSVIGFGGISRIQWGGRDSLNLYYRFAAISWGYGYATEVARTAVRLAENHLSEFPVIARINPVNTPSIKVAEKVGLELNKEVSNDEYAVYTVRW